MPSQPSLRVLDRLADRVRQHRQGSDRPFLIVEGPDDLLTLAPVLPDCDIFPADGKAGAVEAAATLEGWGIDRFACVVDADLYGDQPPPMILARYYPYLEADLEAMLIAMGVLEDLLLHVGSRDKIRSQGGASALVGLFCRNVAVVTSLRQQNAKEGWSLAFDKIDMSSKVDRNTLELRVNSYCMALLAVSDAAPSATQAALLEAAAQAPKGPFTFRGKDAITIAGVALRAKAGTLPLAATSEVVLSAQVRGSAGLRLSRSDWVQGLLAVISA